MPHTLYGQIGSAVTLLACLFAIFNGATPERIAASAVLITSAGVILFQDRLNFLDPQRRLLGADVALMVVFGTLLTAYPRRWLIPATACQILSTALHFAAGWVPGVRPYAYLSVLVLLGYLQLIALVAGSGAVARARLEAYEAEATAQAARLCRDFGPDRALHWVNDAIRKARGSERRQLQRLSAHVAKRVWPDPSRGDTATRMLDR